MPIQVAFLRGTTADMNGNITMKREAMTLGVPPIAMAAKNSGGIVIVQVERIAVAGPFGHNPGLGPRGPHCGVAAPCLADSQAASPRLALEAHWPERDPRRECQQTLRRDEPIRLRCHDEVVLVEPLDLLGLPGHLRPAPAESDIRMVPFRLGKLAEAGDEGHGFLEVAELEIAFDATPFVQQAPARRLRQISAGFRLRERRNTAAAGRTRFGKEIVEI